MSGSSVDLNWRTSPKSILSKVSLEKDPSWRTPAPIIKPIILEPILDTDELTIGTIFPESRFILKLLGSSVCGTKILAINKTNDKDKYMISIIHSHHSLDDFDLSGVKLDPITNELTPKKLMPKNFYFNITIQKLPENDDRSNASTNYDWVIDTPDLYDKIKKDIIPKYIEKEKDEYSFLGEILDDVEFTRHSVLISQVFNTIQSYILGNVKLNIASNSKFTEECNKYFTEKIKTHITILSNKLANNIPVNIKLIDNNYRLIKSSIENIIKDLITAVDKLIGVELLSRNADKDHEYCIIDPIIKKKIVDLIRNTLRYIMEQLSVKNIDSLIANLKIPHETIKNDKYLFKPEFDGLSDELKDLKIIGTPDPTKMTINLQPPIEFIHYNIWIDGIGEIYSLRDLRGKHLEMLIQLRAKFKEFITKTFFPNATNLDDVVVTNIYLKYPSKIWRLHFDATITNFVTGESFSQRIRIHTLDQIINNLEFDPDFYKDMKFNYLLPDTHNILTLYRQSKQSGGNIDALKGIGIRDPNIKQRECGVINIVDSAVTKSLKLIPESPSHPINAHIIEPIPLKEIMGTKFSKLIRDIKVESRFYTGNYLYLKGFSDAATYKLYKEGIRWTQITDIYFRKYLPKKYRISPTSRLALKQIYKASIEKPFIENINEQYTLKQFPNWKAEKIAFETDNFYFILNSAINAHPIMDTDTEVFYTAWWNKKIHGKKLNITDDNYLHSCFDLKQGHIPMLKDIKKKGKCFLSEKYSISGKYIDVYCHYHVAAGHATLHIHFVFNNKMKQNLVDSMLRRDRLFSLDFIINILDLYDDEYFKKIFLDFHGHNELEEDMKKIFSE
jgi:hypothetical protein